MESLSREDVLVRLNGRGLTKGAWEDFSSLRLAFYKLMKPNEREENFRRVKQSTAAACLPYFIQNSILHDASDEYKKTHGDYSAADRASVRTWLEKKYVSENAKNIRSFKMLGAYMGQRKLARAFEEEINTEVEDELYLKVACSNRYVIEEYVISNVYKKLIVNNYLAETTNKTILATAFEVHKKAKAGQDFQELADKYSMEIEYRDGEIGDMGECTEADFPGEEVVWKAVKDLEPGQITGVLDADDSWQIIKVLSRDDSNQAEPKLHLSRIYFRRAWVIPRPSREIVIEELENDRRNKLIKETMSERLPKARIEFPYGKQVFRDVSPAQPMLDVIEGKTTNAVEVIQGGV